MKEMLFPEFIRKLDLSNPDLPAITEASVDVLNSRGYVVAAMCISLRDEEIYTSFAQDRYYRRLVVDVEKTRVKVNEATLSLSIEIYTRHLSRK